jgi:hypothetical protein
MTCSSHDFGVSHRCRGFWTLFLTGVSMAVCVIGARFMSWRPWGEKKEGSWGAFLNPRILLQLVE